MLYTFIAFILVSYVAFHTASGTVILLLELDNTTCPYQIRHMNGLMPYEVRWDGQELPSYCKLSFVGRDPLDASTSFRVCVKAYEYDVKDCDFRMKYYGGFDHVADREFSCYSGLPVKFCADEDEYLDIKFEAATSSASSVKLMITADKIDIDFEDENHRVFVYVGVGMAVTAGIVVCIVLFVLYQKRQQRRAGVLQHTTPVKQSPTMYMSAPLNQPYEKHGQGNYPTPAMNAQHSTAVPPPPYSEVSAEPAKLPLSTEHTPKV